MTQRSMRAKKPRVLIFVIAYHAETTLLKVLDRIPQAVLERFECHVLIVDDASGDRTYDLGRSYKEARPDLPMTVLKNGLNQGYGGNQKVGYAFAIKEDYDFVAMVHGDGQYAPEELPNLLEPLVANTADAVFGSRMMTPFGALQGGMPLYKFVGNKILTRAQNAMLGVQLSEFHSGYRIYRVAALARIPFKLNSDDFHFDTEIIIQLLNAKLRIKELPIPTYYGDEICRVDGIKYAKNVLLTTAQNALHRVGLVYQRRFDVSVDDNSHYDLKLGYASSHSFAIDAVPPGSKVLDIGAGPGGVAAELVKRDCKVTVVDQHKPKTPDREVTVVVQDLNSPLSDALGKTLGNFDYILMLDVIEHVNDPEKFLAGLRDRFDFAPRTLILTTPNIAFVVQRAMLLVGQFNYGKAGILDRTHTRLFTFRSLKQLLDDAGFDDLEVKGVPVPFPKVFGNGAVGRWATELNEALIKLAPTLFSYQIFVKAKCRPSVEYVLGRAEEQARHPTALAAGS